MTPLKIRKMEVQDLDRGFLEVIRSLRPTEMNYAKQSRVFHQRRKEGIHTYVAVVGNQVIGTASLWVETKYIHDGGRVAHIEDVVVLKSEQHQGVGTALVESLVRAAMTRHCYKVILDCEADTMPFYEKVGFQRWQNCMRVDL